MTRKSSRSTEHRSAILIRSRRRPLLTLFETPATVYYLAAVAAVPTQSHERERQKMKSLKMILIVGFIIIAAFITTVYLLHRAYHGGANNTFGGLNNPISAITPA
jgi:hypothetical protein